MHLIPRYITAVKQSVAYVFDLGTAAAGAVVGTVTAMGAIQFGQWVAPGFFLVALLALNTLEMLSAWWTTPRGDRGAFGWETRIVGKLLILALVAVSLLLDGMIYFGSTMLPHDVLPLLQKGFLPITISSLVWLIVAEASHTVQNIRQSPRAASYIPPVVVWVLNRIRKEDAERYPGPLPRPRRRIDTLTEEDIRDMLENPGDGDPPPLEVPRS